MWQIKQLKSGVHVVVGTSWKIEDQIQNRTPSYMEKIIFSIALICTTRHWIPTSASTNQGN
jgi:hypothetical protein